MTTSTKKWKNKIDYHHHYLTSLINWPSTDSVLSELQAHLHALCSLKETIDRLILISLAHHNHIINILIQPLGKCKAHTHTHGTHTRMPYSEGYFFIKKRTFWGGNNILIVSKIMQQIGKTISIDVKLSDKPPPLPFCAHNERKRKQALGYDYRGIPFLLEKTWHASTQST